MRTLFIALLLTASLEAQTVVTTPTWSKVAAESATTSATLPPGTTYRFGTTLCATTNAPAWSASTPVTKATAINPVSMAGANPFPFPDPCQGTTKELDVMETSTAQTIATTVAGKSTPMTVPALVPPPPVTPPAPTSITFPYPATCSISLNATTGALVLTLAPQTKTQTLKRGQRAGKRQNIKR